MRRVCVFSAALLLAAPFASAQDRSTLEDQLDIFAAAHFDSIQMRSFAEKVEYCGWLGFDALGTMVATPAKRGAADHCDLDDPPAGFEILASYHTHGAYDRDADTEVPSIGDLEGDFEEGVDGYIATPGGRLWLNLVEEQISIQLCGPGCVVADSSFRECPAFPPAEEYTIADLQAREDEDTGEC